MYLCGVCVFVCVTQTPLGIDYKDCLIEKNDRFHLAGIHSSFDSLKQLTDFYKRNTLILSEIPVKLGICCPPQAKGMGQMGMPEWDRWVCQWDRWVCQ